VSGRWKEGRSLKCGGVVSDAERTFGECAENGRKEPSVPNAALRTDDRMLVKAAVGGAG